MSLCVIGQTSCSFVCDSLSEDYEDHEGNKFPHQTSRDPISEAFSEPPSKQGKA